MYGQGFVGRGLCRVPYVIKQERMTTLLLGAREVGVCPRVDLDQLADLDEERHVDGRAGLQDRRLGAAFFGGGFGWVSVGCRLGVGWVSVGDGWWVEWRVWGVGYAANAAPPPADTRARMQAACERMQAACKAANSTHLRTPCCP